MGAPREQQFHHTHVACYLCGVAAIVCAFHDSVQGVTQRFHLSKKWFYLYGTICFFAYMYIRPIIRRGLGSAERGYINFYTVYIVWLCSAVFYHLPSMETLGIDIKADISLLLTVFVSSFVALGALHLLHSALVALGIVLPRLANPTSPINQRLSMLILNSACLALACSTYYSFCGNHADAGASAGGLKHVVCSSAAWHRAGRGTHPLPWMLFGEQPLGSNATTAAVGTSSVQPSGAVSPVVVMWFTMFAMFVVNCAADYAAAGALHADTTARLRKGHIDLVLTSLADLQGGLMAHNRGSRRRSLEMQAPVQYGWDLHAAVPRRHNSDGTKRAPPGMLTSASKSMEILCSSLTDLRRTWLALAATLPLGGRAQSVQGGSPTSCLSRSSSVNSLDSFRVEADVTRGSNQERQWTNEEDGAPSEHPVFLPMFPWYSGTSADLLKTALDLVVSVKLFLGRFDMRAMHASLAGHGSDGGGSGAPHAGDGYLFDHVSSAKEVWFDFTADTGDGGDPTYAVARMMAAPQLTVAVPEAWLCKGGSSASASALGLNAADVQGASPRVSVRTLPRGNFLIHGGDLAYPNPCKETYDKRLFRPYEAAFPPPPDVHPGHLVVHKPDLAEVRTQLRGMGASKSSGCTCHGGGGVQVHVCAACLKADALRRYDGPTCFLVPGNHDWFDGLETYQRHILHKGWIGGWLMPQEASYFALQLPHGWWFFGFDLALDEDIDLCQFRYFASIADTLMGPNDQAILLTHQPTWLLDWYWGKRLAPNLQQLIRRHLRGRARMHIAGDLHFYMRHSAQKAAETAQQPGWEESTHLADSFANAPALLGGLYAWDAASGGGSPLGGSPRGRSPLGGSPLGGSPIRGRSPVRGASPPGPVAAPAAALAAAASVAAGQGTKPAVLHPMPASPAPPAASTTDVSSASDRSNSCDDDHTNETTAPAKQQPSVTWAPPPPVATAPAPVQAAPQGPWAPTNPEHLVVCGMGGAFMHPTHVFSESVFGPSTDVVDGPVFVHRPSGHGSNGLRSLLQAGSKPPVPQLYACASAYPAAAKSQRLGRDNLGLFRLHNTRFDVIGGLLYYALVVSVIPRCNVMAAVLEAPTLLDSLTLFGRSIGGALSTIFQDSYLSMLVVAGFFLFAHGFACGGGVGCLSHHSAPPRGKGGIGKAGQRLHPSQIVRARMGGTAQQLLFATLHASTHLLVAVVLLLLLELGIETCIHYQSVGREGYHSLYRWYTAFEQEHFPDPQGLRRWLASWSLGLYPRCLQWLMAVFDVPESIAVTREIMCSGEGAALSRVQTIGYYAGVLAYYWLLATPAVGYLFGAYLYVAVNLCNVHFDEAFSSLRIPNHKGFCRFHISPSGDLEMYALAQDRIPCRWREDPRWRGAKGGGARGMRAQHAKYPSRWAPDADGAGGTAHYSGVGEDDTCSVKVVDYIHVPRKRPAP